MKEGPLAASSTWAGPSGLGQRRALRRWAMRHLSGDPKASLVILGGFNDGPTGRQPQPELRPACDFRIPNW